MIIQWHKKKKKRKKKKKLFHSPVQIGFPNPPHPNQFPPPYHRQKEKVKKKKKKKNYITARPFSPPTPPDDDFPLGSKNLGSDRVKSILKRQFTGGDRAPHGPGPSESSSKWGWEWGGSEARVLCPSTAASLGLLVETRHKGYQSLQHGKTRDAKEKEKDRSRGPLLVTMCWGSAQTVPARREGKKPLVFHKLIQSVSGRPFNFLGGP